MIEIIYFNLFYMKSACTNFIFLSISLLPAPTQVVWDREDEAREQKLRQRPVSALVKAVVTAPPYGQRRGWIPRNPEVYNCRFKIFLYLLQKIC